MIRARLAVSTHTGLIRRRNEDARGGTEMPPAQADGEVIEYDVEASAVLALVADGLGGHPCGDRASSLAVSSVLQMYPMTPEALVGSVHEANDAIYLAMKDDTQSIRMGTTIAAILVHSEGLAVTNVGDSPVFELVDDRFIQLTTDDVPGRRAALPGIPSSIVTQTLGGSTSHTPVRPHLHCDDVFRPRRLLLCTDGLTNFVMPADILESLREASPRNAVSRLIELTLNAGAPDNVTAIVVDVAWV